MMWQPLRDAGFGSRLLLAQCLVVVAGSATLLGVALLLAPGLFSTHLTRAGVPLSDELEQHLSTAFETATLLSLAGATLVATVTALLGSWFVTRRVVRPILAMADAAGAVADGDYTVRVPDAGLGAEFDAVSHAFNQMSRSIEATEHTRAEILRDVAHELRTPLSAVRGYLEGVADGVLTLDQATHATIETELSRIERLVRDIARVSEAEERRLDLQVGPVAVDRLVQHIVEALGPRYDDKGVALTASLPPDVVEIDVDEDRFQEVLTNLLDNALRHTPTGGRVTVEASRQQQGVEVLIGDTGEGIADDELPRVFERFYRVDRGRSPDRGGSGIGLAIARALVEAHGGRIRAESPGPDQGSTFRIWLPASSPSVDAPVRSG